MRQRHEIWAATPAQAATAMAMTELAGKLTTIGHLNITPELLGQSLQQSSSGVIVATGTGATGWMR